MISHPSFLPTTDTTTNSLNRQRKQQTREERGLQRKRQSPITMSTPTLRKSLTAFSARLGKQTQTLPATRRSGGGAVRPGYNNLSSPLRNRTACATKTTTTRSLWTSSRATGVVPFSVRSGSGSVRWNSGKEEPSWRQWGFEDVWLFVLPPFHSIFVGSN